MKKAIGGLVCLMLALVACAAGVTMNLGIFSPQAQTQVQTNTAQAAQVTTKAAVINGWNSSKTKYYVDGLMVTGAYKINGKWYLFNTNGTRLKSSKTIGKVTYYVNPNTGYIDGRKKGSSYYYANGAAMTSNDTKDYKCVLCARKVVKKITNTSDSKATKLKKCFKWVVNKYYKIHRHFPYTSNWPAIYAMDHFKNIGGDCHADGSALAYLAYAIGYTDVYACNDCKSSSNGKIGGHCWAQINGKVYDPLFAQAKTSNIYGKYYACSYSDYYTHAATWKIKIPFGSAKHATSSAPTARSGLYTSSAGNIYYYFNGVMVKSKWVTIGSKKYYFASNGRAVKGKSAKINGTYYVFNAKGVLCTGDGVRIVKIGSDSYQVDADGKAVHTTSLVDGQQYFSTSGKLLCGSWVINDRFYQFSGTGVYDKAATAQVRTVVKQLQANYSANIGDPDKLAALTDLIGQPKNVETSDECGGTFTQLQLWEYDHFSIVVYELDGKAGAADTYFFYSWE